MISVLSCETGKDHPLYLHDHPLFNRKAKVRNDLQSTPLHAWHLERQARMVPFAGWEMPLQYRGILEEHAIVRQRGGFFDVSHMGVVRLSGPEAAPFLDSVLTNHVARLKPGRAHYTFLCREDGGVIDDLIVYCETGEEYWLCLNAANTPADLAWLRESSSGRNLTLTDTSASTGLLAVQGPVSEAALTALGAAGLDKWKAFHCGRLDLAGYPVFLSRTGYTGEDGFEIFCQAADCLSLAEALAGVGLPPIGLGARDSLRLEAGYPLHGAELSHEISPVQAGILWPLKFDKPGGFVGREALLHEHLAGPARRVVFFQTPDRRIIRPGAGLRWQDRPAGQVLSGTLSPILQVAIGSALVETSAAEASSWQTEIRGRMVELTPVNPPFVPLTRSKLPI